MVSFICNACGQTVKKVQVERHYLNECRSCDVLSCIDCGKDFHGDEYVSHTKCITEAEKYQGKLYKPKDKQNKGEQKQQEWLKSIKEATKSDTADPRIASLLERIGEYSNIPRKRAKFQNFCKNSVNVRDSQTLDKLWDIFSESTKKDVQTSEDNSNGTVEHDKDEMSAQENGAETSRELEKSANSKKQKKGKKLKDSDTSETEQKSKEKKKKMPDRTEEEYGHKKEKRRKRKRSDNTVEMEEESQSKASKVSLEENEKKENDAEDQEDAKLKGHFNWKSVIKAVLREAPDQELPIKRLRKKVLAEFQAREANDRHLSENELRALFDKKVTKNPTFKVHKDRVKLVK